MRREGIRDCWVFFITFSSVAWKNLTLGRLWSLILDLSCGLKRDRTTDKNKEEMNFPLDSLGKTALRGGGIQRNLGEKPVFSGVNGIQLPPVLTPAYHRAIVS